MTEQAEVIRVDGATALLKCSDHQGCTKCGSAFCTVTARTYHAAIDPGIKIHEHDRVEVFVPPTGAVWAGFLVLIVPLLGFLVGYLVAGRSVSEPLRVLAGVAVMGLTFAAVYLFGKKRSQPWPRIVSVIRPSVPAR